MGTTTIDNLLGVGALSLWVGFAIADQVHAQTRLDSNGVTGGSKRWVIGRMLMGAVGIAGMLGMASLLGSMPAFQGPEFPIGFVLGILLYVIAHQLTKGAT